MKDKKEQFTELSRELHCVTSSDGFFVYLNTVAEKILGYSSNDLLGKSILKFISPLDQAKTNKAVAQLIEGKNIPELENRCICKNGTVLHVSWRANYAKHSKEIYWVGHHISAYKLSPFENGVNYQNLIKNMNLGFVYAEIIVDEANVPCDAKILHCNNYIEKLIGIMPNTIVGKRVLEVFPDIEQEWIDVIGKVAISQKSITYTDYSHITKKYYEVHAFSPEKGKFVEIFKDVTETVSLFARIL